jgi:hypothetical protein
VIAPKSALDSGATGQTSSAAARRLMAYGFDDAGCTAALRRTNGDELQALTMLHGRHIESHVDSPPVQVPGRGETVDAEERAEELDGEAMVLESMFPSGQFERVGVSVAGAGQVVEVDPVKIALLPMEQRPTSVFRVQVNNLFNPSQ